MKKVLAVIAAASIATASFAAVHADDEISVLLDGQPISFDVPPQIVEDRTLVPFRAIFEALGYEVGWDQETQTVSGVKGDVTLEMVIGSTTATITTVVAEDAEDADADDAEDADAEDEDAEDAEDADAEDAEDAEDADAEDADDEDAADADAEDEDADEADTATVAEPKVETVTFDVPPQIIDDRTLVPVRAVGEMSGYLVDWIGDTRTVTIDTPEAEPEAPEAPTETAAPETTDAPEATEAPETTDAPEATEAPKATAAPEADSDLPVKFDDTAEILASHTRNFKLLTAVKNDEGKYDITFEFETFKEGSGTVAVQYNCLDASGKVVDTFGENPRSTDYTWTPQTGSATISGDTVTIVLAN